MLKNNGMLSMVRDIFQTSGFLGVGVQGRIVQIGLNPVTLLASILVNSLQELLSSAHITIQLDKHLLAPKKQGCSFAQKLGSSTKLVLKFTTPN